MWANNAREQEKLERFHRYLTDSYWKGGIAVGVQGQIVGMVAVW